MIRRLLHFGTLLSLLLCVTVCVLWVRSLAVPDYWYQQTWDGRRAAEMELQSYWGRLRFQYQSQPETRPRPGLNDGWHHQRFNTGYWKSERDFWLWGWYFVESRHGLFAWVLRLNHGSLALLTAAAPAAWLRGFVRRRRHRAAGFCAACGYDLRASPARCPECGTVPVASTTG